MGLLVPPVHVCVAFITLSVTCWQPGVRCPYPEWPSQPRSQQEEFQDLPGCRGSWGGEQSCAI